LYKKYVADNSKYRVPLSPATITELEARLKAPPTDLDQYRLIYNDAKMEVVSILDPVFLKEFVSTPAWEKFLATNRLPADYEP